MTGSIFAGILAAHGGDKVAASLEVARNLMRGDAAAFKAGYSAESAYLAVRALYDLDDEQAAAVRGSLMEEGDEQWD